MPSKRGLRRQKIRAYTSIAFVVQRFLRSAFAAMAPQAGLLSSHAMHQSVVELDFRKKNSSVEFVVQHFFCFTFLTMNGVAGRTVFSSHELSQPTKTGEKEIKSYNTRRKREESKIKSYSAKESPKTEFGHCIT